MFVHDEAHKLLIGIFLVCRENCHCVIYIQLDKYNKKKALFEKKLLKIYGNKKRGGNKFYDDKN